MERGFPTGMNIFGINGDNVRQEYVGSDDPGIDIQRDIVVMATSDTQMVIRANTLESRSSGVYTEELSGLKIKSRGNFQVGWGRAMRKYQGKKIAFSDQCYHGHSLSPG